jgi:hypothetical protein
MKENEFYNELSKTPTPPELDFEEISRLGKKSELKRFIKIAIASVATLVLSIGVVTKIEQENKKIELVTYSIDSVVDEFVQIENDDIEYDLLFDL